MVSEKYLDELVIELADLEILRRQAEKDMSKFFLENLGLDQIENYIQGAIRKRIPIDLIPDGELYVFTPYHGLRYQKKGKDISTSATRSDEFGSEGTLDEAIKHIRESAETAKREQRKFSINALFYDELSKRNFNDKIKPTLELSESRTLTVPGYGDIKLYNYWIPHFK